MTRPREGHWGRQARIFPAVRSKAWHMGRDAAYAEEGERQVLGAQELENRGAEGGVTARRSQLQHWPLLKGHLPGRDMMDTVSWSSATKPPHCISGIYRKKGNTDGKKVLRDGPR